MDRSGLRASSRPEGADWIDSRLGLFGSVAGIVPGGFPAYARILHPASGPNGEPVRWTDVAAASGRVMHRLVQFHAIDYPPESGPGTSIQPPETGIFPLDLLRILCGLLSRHTRTAESCWFCLWEGYGELHGSVGKIVFTPVGMPETADEEERDSLPPAIQAAVLKGPCVHLPARNYFLFEGPLESATEFEILPFRHSPNLFWPEDHAWCVASEIDLFCTLVGGSEALVESLVADPHLEVWRVSEDDPVTWGSDDKNPI
jgi:hypothetical protein